MKFKKAFTLIELLVVIAIIGLLATLSVLALNNARLKARDSKRLADVKQIQTSLELYFNSTGHYPSSEEFASGKIESYSPTTGTSTYMVEVPSAPTPADGSCSNTDNAYTYIPSADGTDYDLNFCVAKSPTSSLPDGNLVAFSGGIKVGVANNNGGGGDNVSEPNSPAKFVSVFSSEYQYATGVYQTSDGGYILSGNTSDNGYDIQLIKTDSSGNRLWTKTFGDSGQQTSRSVKQTADGGYIVLGDVWSYSGSDFYVIKTDASGTEVWSNNFDAGLREYSSDIQQTSDGGYIIAGSSDALYSNGGAFVVKIDSNGQKIWDHAFDNGGSVSIRQTTDGGYILSTNKYSYPNMVLSLLKLDASGNKTWENIIYNAPGGSGGYAQQTSDGGYVAATIISGPSARLIKTDSSGVETWHQDYVGFTNNLDVVSVQQTSDGGYAIFGNTSIDNGDAYIIKTDASGTEVWRHTYIGFDTENISSARQTADGGYVMVGSSNLKDDYSNYKMLFLKTNASGAFNCSNTAWVPDESTYAGSATQTSNCGQTRTHTGTCAPVCAGRNCGDDSCGGTCGTCSGSDYCNGSGVCTAVCFLSGTKISMADGSLKDIENVAIGDMVKSYDFASRKNTSARVNSLIRHQAEESNGYLVINNLLRVTPNHEIFINGYWQEIGKAKIGDVLRNEFGQPVIIFSIEKLGEKVPTYNLEIDAYHNYYADYIMVHNGLGGGC